MTELKQDTFRQCDSRTGQQDTFRQCDSRTTINIAEQAYLTSYAAQLDQLFCSTSGPIALQHNWTNCFSVQQDQLPCSTTGLIVLQYIWTKMFTAKSITFTEL